MNVDRDALLVLLATLVALHPRAARDVAEILERQAADPAPSTPKSVGRAVRAAASELRRELNREKGR